MILRQTGEDSPRSSRRGGVPLIGTAAAIGLSVFFVCALYTHVRASDYSSQFGLAIGFLLLAVAALVQAWPHLLEGVWVKLGAVTATVGYEPS